MLQMGGLKKKSFISYISTAGNPRSERQHGQVLERASSGLADGYLPAESAYGKERELCVSPSYKDTKAITGVLPS